jgi:hypothetical protein
MVLENAFANNQKLTSHFHSSLADTTIHLGKWKVLKAEEEKWIVNHQVFVESFSPTHTANSFEIITRSRFTLRKLELNENVATSVEDVSQLGQFPSLISLRCESDHMSDNTMSAILQVNPQLTNLDLSFMNLLSNQILYRISESCPNLRKLTLASNDWVTDESVRILTTGCHQLAYLDLQETMITDEQTIFLLLNSFRKLCYVTFSFPPQSDALLLRFLRQVTFRPFSCDDEADDHVSTQSWAIQCLLFQISNHVLLGKTFLLPGLC